VALFKRKKLCEDARVINVILQRSHGTNDKLVTQLQRQNRLLKQSLGVASVALIALLRMDTKVNEEREEFSEIDVERIIIVDVIGKPNAGMHLSMDRFGGDMQWALGHYENGGLMETGLNVHDRGLVKDNKALFEAMQKAPEGAERTR
jgi:hypothetical protein